MQERKSKKQVVVKLVKQQKAVQSRVIVTLEIGNCLFIRLKLPPSVTPQKKMTQRTTFE